MQQTENDAACQTQHMLNTLAYKQLRVFTRNAPFVGKLHPIYPSSRR